MTAAIDLAGLPPETCREAIVTAHRACAASSLPHWVVFGPGTTDFPGRHVARLWTALPTPKCLEATILADDIETIRDALPGVLVRMERDPSDDANILEVWL